jgi:mitochondrial fission protein ELM1
VVRLLERAGVPVELDLLRVQNRLPGVLRGVMRKLINVSPVWISGYLLRLFCRFEKSPAQAPALIISSGGKSAFASRVLKRKWRSANLFVGVPAPFPDRWFDLILSPVARPFDTASLVTGVIPNAVTPEAVAEAGQRYWQENLPTQPCWVVMIGGDSKSHRFQEPDWSGLIEGIRSLAQKQGVYWLITTSRRTPESVETRLQEELADCPNIAELVLYNREPKRVMQPFLAAAQRVLVTQDSLTMASEALCSGRPVTLLAPQDVRLDPGSFFEEIVEGFPRLPGVERVAMTELSAYKPEDNKAVEPVSLEPLVAPLLAELKRLNVYNRQ